VPPREVKTALNRLFSTVISLSSAATVSERGLVLQPELPLEPVAGQAVSVQDLRLLGREEKLISHDDEKRKYDRYDSSVVHRYLTGSKPPSWKGLHFSILRAASEVPFRVPYLLIASTAYSEQVGVNLQLEGNIGDTAYLYVLIVAITSFFMVQSENGPSYASVQSTNSASGAVLLATITMSWHRGCSVNSFLKISLRRRFTLFLVTALPTFLLTARPSLLWPRRLGSNVEDKMFGRKFPALLKYDLELALPSQRLKKRSSSNSQLFPSFSFFS